MQKIFSNKELKNAISLILTVGIGMIGSSMGSWDVKTDKFFHLKLTSLIIFSLMFIAFLILSYIYDRKETKILDERNNEIESLKSEIKSKEKELKTYEKSQLALSAILETSADDINTTANNIKKNDIISLDNWNFRKECTWICEKVLSIVSDLSINGDDFDVSIFQLNPLSKGKSKSITMIAHASKFRNTPDIYGIPLSFRSNSKFYAIKLFKKNKHEPDVLIDKNEINEKFTYNDENNHPNYSQYIAVPIHCNGNDMLSLLQIISFGESKLGNTKIEITQKINKCLLPYTRLGLMSYKYEKALLASGYLVEKVKGGAVNG